MAIDHAQLLQCCQYAGHMPTNEAEVINIEAVEGVGGRQKIVFFGLFKSTPGFRPLPIKEASVYKESFFLQPLLG